MLGVFFGEPLDASKEGVHMPVTGNWTIIKSILYVSFSCTKKEVSQENNGKQSSFYS
jgi:hypothetical protein